MGTNSLGKNITQLRLFFRWREVVSNRQLMLVRIKNQCRKRGILPSPRSFLHWALRFHWSCQRGWKGGTISGSYFTCSTSETSHGKTADAESQAHPLEPCVDRGPSSQGVQSMHRPELRRRSAARLEAGKSKLSPANHRAEHMHVEDGTVVCSFLSKLNILHVPL